MKPVLAALRRQPVRAYLYGLLGPAVGVAGAYGLVSEQRGVLWIALGGAVLLPFGVETARAKVTPLSRPRNNDGDPLGVIKVSIDGGKTVVRGTGLWMTRLDGRGKPIPGAEEPFVPDVDHPLEDRG